jgi:hypothetical protein
MSISKEKRENFGNILIDISEMLKKNASPGLTLRSSKRELHGKRTPIPM